MGDIALAGLVQGVEWVDLMLQMLSVHLHMDLNNFLRNSLDMWDITFYSFWACVACDWFGLTSWEVFHQRLLL